MMELFDNIYSKEQNDEVFKHLVTLPYYVGEADNPGQVPTGVVHNFDDSDESFFEYIQGVIFQHAPHLAKLKLQRKYVNLFQAGEHPNWHQDCDGEDGECTTVLIYVMPEELHGDEGGETQFWMDETIIGIKAKPCRMVIFDGTMMHRATSFRSYPRLTIAVKYGE